MFQLVFIAYNNNNLSELLGFIKKIFDNIEILKSENRYFISNAFNISSIKTNNTFIYLVFNLDINQSDVIQIKKNIKVNINIFKKLFYTSIKIFKINQISYGLSVIDESPLFQKIE